MIKTLLSFVFVLWGTATLAALPRTSFVLDEMTKRAGKGTYEIEQDVILNSATSTLTLRESWIVSSDGQMRLTMRGPKEMAEPLRLQSVYAGGQKHFQTARGRQAAKLGDDFIERYFHTRSREAFYNLMVNQKVLPAGWLAHRPSKTGKDYVYPPEAQKRLTRVGGVTAIGFGEPSKSTTDLRPGYWVEQDQFLLRKFRLPSRAEVTADQYAMFPRGLWLPQNRIVTWTSGGSQKTATIQVVKVSALPASAKIKPFVASSLDVTTQMGGVADSELATTLEEFYSRFR